MKSSFYLSVAAIASLFLVTSCDKEFEDPIPVSFQSFKLRGDEIYIYNSATPSGVRLDPFVNDSIKVDVSVSYGNPVHGSIEFITNEGWFYTPNAGFFGTDEFNYTVCYEKECLTAPIRMIVEEPVDLANCTFQINGEEVETTKDQPIEIRMYLNDVVCPYMGGGMYAPEKGTFETYSYSGTFKNIVYVYYPPKGFTGTDRFKYRLFTDSGTLETFCTIIVK